ncbi:hypothetical protein X798_05749 [Onchocerca flexuosa]|uniref:Uncharacterized protein n=1 Tax=Onchocerca flexuosa TaxID=387005 RepID=A0A238BRH5_9BILA|nr:hypothetical protein X798_05749 [Onchocerca flexuosa]
MEFDRMCAFVPLFPHKNSFYLHSKNYSVKCIIFVPYIICILVEIWKRHNISLSTPVPLILFDERL